jgi:uncharacterized protein (UPF0333 family)
LFNKINQIKYEVNYMRKKGQAAMEFLMTYGWAIVVVLAAIGALAYFGVLSPNKLLPDRTTFAAPISNVDNAVVTQANGQTQVEIAFKNNKGVPITVPGVTTVTSTQCTGTGAMDTIPAGAIQNGGGFLVKWNCTTSGTQAVGNKFKADISFDYINNETGQTIKQVGSVEGKYS